jgi:hypothetical protein
MIPALQTVLDVILGITPVPGLYAAFNILKLIVYAVEQASKSKQRLAILAQCAAQLLKTINVEFSASRLVHSACREPLNDLQRCMAFLRVILTLVLIFALGCSATSRNSSVRSKHVRSSKRCLPTMPDWRE